MPGKQLFTTAHNDFTGQKHPWPIDTLGWTTRLRTVCSHPTRGLDVLQFSVEGMLSVDHLPNMDRMGGGQDKL